MPQPSLIIVTGRPGTGKSTLARQLADTLRLPLLSRDSLKEGYVQTQGRAHSELAEDVNQRMSQLFFATLQAYCRNEVSVVAEAAFQHGVWASRMMEVQGIADVRFIVCECDDAVLEMRRAQRETLDPFHRDAHGQAQNIKYAPPDLGVPLLRVNTEVGCSPSLDLIEKFALNGT